MEEFTDNIRQQAAQTLRSMFGQYPLPDVDPILELMAFLLEKGRGAELTTERWFLWNQLVMDQQAELVQAMNSVLEMEQAPLPTDHAAMRYWAEWLVTSTLDRIEME